MNMKINKFQSKIGHNTINDLCSVTQNNVLTNLQFHSSLISQLSCLYPFIHQQNSIPSLPSSSSGSSILILNHHLHYYLKSKQDDYYYLNQSLIDSTDTSNREIRELKNNQRDLINEINWITKEKIDSIQEKEKIDEELESYYQTERQTKRQPIATPEGKKKKLKELKAQYAKMTKTIIHQKKAYDDMQIRNKTYVNENKILIEKIKQKQLIYDQVISDVNGYKIALTKHKKLISIASKDTQDSASTTSTHSSKRNKSTGLFKKLFK